MEKSSVDDASIDLVRIKDKLRLYWLKKIKKEQIDIQLALYIPTMLGFTEKEDIEKRLDGVNEIQHFFDSDKKLMLLLGDSGAGKSLFGQWLVNDIWGKNSAYIPIFIHLPSIKIKAGFFEKYLKKQFDLTKEEIEFLKTSGKLFIILDSYDEMVAENQGKNLHRIGKFYSWNAKVVISCRTEALVRYSKKDQSDMFSPYLDEKNQNENENVLEKRYVQFFDRKTQVPQYIEQWKSQNKELVDPTMNYFEVMNKLPGLSEMISSPFILMIVMPALPKLLKQYMEKHETERFDLTRMALFAAFTSAWFERQRDKLHRNEVINDIWVKSIVEDFHSYCEQLANLMWQNQVESVTYDPKKHPDDKQWEPFFAAEGDFNEDKHKPLKLIRQGALLRIIDGKTYTFLHKSLLEYFAAKKLFESAANKASIALGLEMNSQLLTRNFAMVRLGVDCLLKNPVFEKALWDILEESKHEPRVQVAAANAITILNAANRSFAGKDLRRIRIRYANVAGGNFEGADLQESDLRDVDFTQAWLTRANLSGSCLDRIRTVALQGEKLDSAVLSCAFSSNGKKYAVMTNTKVYLYDAESHECLTSGLNNFVSKSAMSGLHFCEENLKFSHFSENGIWNYTVDVKEWLNNPNSSFRVGQEHVEYISLDQRLAAMLLYITLINKNQISKFRFSPPFISGYILSDKMYYSYAEMFGLSREPVHKVLNEEFDAVKDFLAPLISEWLATTDAYNLIKNIIDSETSHQGVLDNIDKYTTDRRIITQFIDDCFDRFIYFTFSDLDKMDEDDENNKFRSCFVFFLVLLKKNVYVWERYANSHDILTQSDTYSDFDRDSMNLFSNEEHERIDVLYKRDEDSSHSWVTSANKLEFVGYKKEDLPKPNIPYNWVKKSYKLHTSPSPYNINKDHYYFRLIELFDGILAMTHSPDKIWFLINHQQKGLILLNTTTKNEQYLIVQNKLSSLDAMIFSPDGSWVLTGLSDGTIKVWHTASGECISTWMAHQVSIMVITKDSTWALSGSLDGTIKQWNIAKGECTATWSGHTDRITSLVLSPDESCLLSGSTDGTLKRWELTPRQLFMGQGHSKSVSSLFLSSNKIWAFTESEDRSSKRWDVKTGQCEETQQVLLSELDKKKWGILDPVSTDNKQWALLWNEYGEKPLTTLIRSDKNWALTGSSDGTIKHWARDKLPLYSTWQAHTSPITAFTSNPDGSLVFSCDNNGKVMLWSVNSGELIARCGILNPVSNIQWFADNPALIMMGMSDGALTLWTFHPKIVSLYLQWRSRPWMIQANNSSLLGVYGLAANQREDLLLKGAHVQVSAKSSDNIIKERNKTEIQIDFNHPPHSFLNHTISLRPEAWVISIVRKKVWDKQKDKKDPREHAFLILESIEGEFYYIRRIDFVLELRNEEFPQGINKPLRMGLIGQGLIEIADKSLFDMQSLVGQCCSSSSGITREKGMKLLENIRQDQAQRHSYCSAGAGNMFRMFRMNEAIAQHNCMSWCEKHLDNIGVNLTKNRWIDGILNYPPIKLYDEKPASKSPRSLQDTKEDLDDEDPTSGSKCVLM